MTVPIPVPPITVSLSPQNAIDTIDVQSRTIRYLINNYNALLAKVQGESGALNVTWTPGAVTAFTAGQIIPAGIWFPLTATSITMNNYAGGTTPLSVAAFQLFFSGGVTTAATAAVSMVQVIASI